MSFLLPIPLATLGWLAAIAGGLTVTAYILKMRRRRFEVPFSTLWHRVLREKEATSLWKRLKRWLSLLLALLVLGLVLFAALEPELGEADDDAQNLVILLDASASMKAMDEGEDGKSTRMEAAVDAGFERISLDLIFGWPGQEIDSWRTDLETVTRWAGGAVSHLSLYSLIVEPGTPLADAVSRGIVTVPDDDAAADLYELAMEVLDAAGWLRVAPLEAIDGTPIVDIKPVLDRSRDE